MTLQQDCLLNLDTATNGSHLVRHFVDQMLQVEQTGTCLRRMLQMQSLSLTCKLATEEIFSLKLATISVTLVEVCALWQGSPQTVGLCRSLCIGPAFWRFSPCPSWPWRCLTCTRCCGQEQSGCNISCFQQARQRGRSGQIQDF